jgi:hypothetical protein
VLHIDLTGRDPDDGATSVPYEKGALFLRTVEKQVGRERFDSWLRGYFDRHAFTSLTTSQFLDDFRQYLEQDDADLETTLKVQDWLEKPGIPSNAPAVADVFTRVDKEVARFNSGTPAASLVTAEWTTQEWQHFLETLPSGMSPRHLQDLDHAFGFSRSGNSEVLFAWLRIAVRGHYQPAMPALERFLTSQGRRKFLTPLYRELLATDWGKEEAKRIYEMARPHYHAVATSTLDGIMRRGTDKK